VYTVKYHPDGSIECRKARLVVKGYTQTYSVDFMVYSCDSAELCSHSYLCAVNRQCPMHELDIKNAFLAW